MLQKVIYTRNGKNYVKASRHEQIKEGAVYSCCGGELKLVVDVDNVIGKIPADFSDEIDFYNPVQ